MDNDLLELADRLCTVAGMIMEDHNMIAISNVGHAEDRVSELAILSLAGSDISTLIAAAQILIRLG